MNEIGKHRTEQSKAKQGRKKERKGNNKKLFILLNFSMALAVLLHSSQFGCKPIISFSYFIEMKNEGMCRWHRRPRIELTPHFVYIIVLKYCY